MDLSVPVPVMTAAGYIGSLVTPLSLLYIGLALAKAGWATFLLNQGYDCRVYWPPDSGSSCYGRCAHSRPDCFRPHAGIGI